MTSLSACSEELKRFKDKRVDIPLQCLLKCTKRATIHGNTVISSAFTLYTLNLLDSFH